MDLHALFGPDYSADDVFPGEEPEPDSVHESQGTAQPPPEMVFNNLEEFVTQFLVHQFQRPVASYGRAEFTWCAGWWRHEEAVNRLNALWRAWEALRVDPTTGLANWWNSYADPTMAVLFSSTGPFQGCTPSEHKPANKPLPIVSAPEGLNSA
ncbi:DUF4913 domain-containing protein [Arthrobacter sp. B1805]|uniref:DUF4913 domain-containing protein n=1 Tax=Arthrobacter sp. B1805 TaxID=2058892 RepID=UPI0021580FF7|nr:DUF4913 domain-containing protein [Arthrobacter sp. B1805]